MRAPAAAPPLRPDTCRSLPEGAGPAPPVSWPPSASGPPGSGAVPPSTTTLRQVLCMGEDEQGRPVCSMSCTRVQQSSTACAGWHASICLARITHATSAAVSAHPYSCACRSPGAMPEAAQVLTRQPTSQSPSTQHPTPAPTCARCREGRSLAPAPAALPPPAQRPCGG